MMRILLIILSLIAKCMNEADHKIWLIETVDENSDTNKIGVEKNNTGEDYQVTPQITQILNALVRRQGTEDAGTDAATSAEDAGTEAATGAEDAGTEAAGTEAAGTEDAGTTAGSDSTGGGADNETATTTGPESTSGAAENETGTTTEPETTTAVIDNEMSSCERSPILVKEAGTLNDDERSLLSGGMGSLKNSTRDWFDVAGIHSEPTRPACGNVPCCLHGDHDGFLPFHRLYLSYANSVLRRHEPNTVIPYWDWTLGGSFPQIAQSGGPFFEAPINDSSRETSSRDGTEVDSMIDRVLDALSENDFRLFTNQIEGIHNDIHSQVGGGGDMSSLAYAAFDPIFFLHHATVDLIWAVQQVVRPDVEPEAGFGSRLDPFGLRGTDTIFCHNYGLQTGTVFGNMTIDQIREEVSQRSGGNGTNSTDYQDRIQDKVYAGFFLNNMDVSGKIKFNICKSINGYQSEDCTIPAGQFCILGGKGQRKTYNSLPYKVDVTEAVTKAGLNATSMCRFKVVSFTDPKGIERPDVLNQLYQPITVFRETNAKKDTYLFAFNKEGPQAPNITVHKGCSYQIDSERDDVDENQDCYGNSTTPQKKEWLSYKEWQNTNSDKYQRWNAKGKHTFSSNVCNDRRYRGTQMEINCE